MEWITLIVVILILLKILVWYLDLPTCPHCKSKKAELVSKEKMKSEPMYFKEKQQIKEYKNSSGQKQYFNWQTKASTNKYFNAPSKVIEKEVLVEGERIYYKSCYKCSKCGKIFSRKEYEDKKPQIVNG